MLTIGKTSILAAISSGFSCVIFLSAIMFYPYNNPLN
jgi:hypothetical protein